MKRLINTSEFTRSSSQLAGQVNGSELLRAADLLFEGRASLEWQVAGTQKKRVEGGFESYLNLKVSGVSQMVCLRCLNSMEVKTELDRTFRLAKDELQAAKLDQDEEIDAIVGSERFELLDLIEDEFIMALPYSPKHENCALPELPATKIGAKVSSNASRSQQIARENSVNSATVEKPNPFRVLAQLKKPNP
jgi:uncharacterized protein